MSENGTKMWIAVIMAVVMGFVSIIFGMINRQTLQEISSLKSEVVEVYRRQAEINARVYKIEGNFLVIIEKLDTLKNTLKEQKEK